MRRLLTRRGRQDFFGARASACALIFLALAFLPDGIWAQERTTSAEEKSWDASLLLLEARLDGYSLSDSLSGYQGDGKIWLPLGELTRLLSLAIQVQPQSGSASGFLVSEDRSFALNVPAQKIVVAGQELPFDASSVKVSADDIYVTVDQLTRWLPLNLDVQLGVLQLVIVPRERLPLQARLERERMAMRLGGPGLRAEGDAYPFSGDPPSMLGSPLIDLTLGGDARFGSGSKQSRSAATALITADFLGMEGSLYLNAASGSGSLDYRAILTRNDPDAGLLGPLRARSFSLGNISVPSVPNILMSSQPGTGFTVSNRKLELPTSFDRQSLRGNLQPGWDVTLYYNDALLGYQQSRGDGLYAFDDLPLSFGRNDFVLVFNGPLGQMRTERQSFTLDQSIVRQGELLYSLTQHRSETGDQRLVARSDLGLTKNLVGSLTWVQMPRVDYSTGRTVTRDYQSLGLRGYFNEYIVTTELSRADQGTLVDLGLKTRIGKYIVDYLHTRVGTGFDSEVFGGAGDAIRDRDALRVLGALEFGRTRLPVQLEVRQDRYNSGASQTSLSGRLSFNLAGTFFTNALNTNRQISASGVTSTTTQGTFQVGGRFMQSGLSGQISYDVQPQSRLSSLALNADRMINEGFRINAGVLHDVVNSRSLVSAALSRNFGPFAISLSGSISSRGEHAIALQVFIALGRNPENGKWFSDGIPMAASGALLARTFLDRNYNGIKDPSEPWIANAGFMINRGGRYPELSSEEGIAMIRRLAPGRYAEIGVDPGTLEDPQWKPATEGVRVLPRAGHVQRIDFPVVSTSDIDGTVYLIRSSGRVPAGNVEIELVNEAGQVVRTTRSAGDGFYLFTQVMPGKYLLRASPAPLERLGLGAERTHHIALDSEGDLLGGMDIELVTLPGKL